MVQVGFEGHWERLLDQKKVQKEMLAFVVVLDSIEVVLVMDNYVQDNFGQDNYFEQEVHI